MPSLGRPAPGAAIGNHSPATTGRQATGKRSAHGPARLRTERPVAGGRGQVSWRRQPPGRSVGRARRGHWPFTRVKEGAEEWEGEGRGREGLGGREASHTGETSTITRDVRHRRDSPRGKLHCNASVSLQSGRADRKNGPASASGTAGPSGRPARTRRHRAASRPSRRPAPPQTPL